MSSSSSSSYIVEGAMGRRVMAEMPVYLPPGAGRERQKPPQKMIDEFWRKFTTIAPGKATTLLPKNEYAEKLARRAAAKEGGSGTEAQASFEEAAALCQAKVDKIIDECRRVNQKYRDPHFDLEFDLKTGRRDCLESLDNVKDEESDSEPESVVSPRRPSPSPPRSRRHRRQRLSAPVDGGGGGIVAETPGGGPADPASPRRPQGRTPGSRFAPKSVKRVGEIFDDPKFYIDGPTANDVRQGRDGDCWLMAALCTLSNKPGLIERICVHHDQDVGVYGFVFHRDGEWFSEIIDDKLFLTKPDYDEAISDRLNIERLLWDDGRERPDSEEIYRKTYQSNSGALYFAQCENPNETWLPLLEKAYAKAHGDYAAIEGGFTGEGIEDLTGGVTSELFTTDILDKESFWKNELMQVNKEFLFGCSTGLWGRGWGERKGIVEQHAYSVMRAVEVDGERLLLLKNPWGKSEWKGPWSDGSKEWTPEWLQKLGHRFGDDGAFWISYKELLRKYQNFDRTRLFGSDWKITSIWTTLSVPWTIEYHDTKFAFTLAKPGPVVIVLSQLDERYFRGLEGQYVFSLAFRVHKLGQDDYLVRTRGSYRMKRSVNVELNLEAGEYIVLVKIDAERFEECMTPEDVVRKNAKNRREKLLRIGLAYDLAHGKAKIVESAEEKAAREAYEKRKKEKYRERMRKAIMKERERNRYRQTKDLKEQRKRIQRNKDKQKAKAEKREAELKKREAEREKVEKEEAEKCKAAKTEAEKKEAEAKQEPDKKSEDEKKPEGAVTGDGKAEEKGEEKPAGTTEEKTEEKKPQELQPTPAAGAGKMEPSSQEKKAEPKTEPEPSQGAEAKSEPQDKDKPVEGEIPEQETSTDPGENTPPTSSSGVAPSEVSAGEYQTPAAGEETDQGARKPGTDAQNDEVRLESQSSFHTSLEVVPETAEKPASEGEPGADTPKEPVVEEGPDKSEELPVDKDKQDASDATIGREVVIEVVDDQGRRPEEANPVLLPPALETEVRGMIDTFATWQNRLKTIIGERDDERQRERERERERDRGRESDQAHYFSEDSERSIPHSPRRVRHRSRHSHRGRRRPPPPPQQQQQHHHHHRLAPPPAGPPQYIPSIAPPLIGMGRPPPPPPPGYNNGYPSDYGSDGSDGLMSIPPVSDVSDTELDYLMEDRMRHLDNLPPPRPAPPVHGRVVEDEFEKDPWNAVAVVGLRVYYKVAEEDKDKEIVTLRVIRPNPFELDDDEDSKKEDGDKEKKEGEEGQQEETDEAKVLDLDDSAKDATIQVVG